MHPDDRDLVADRIATAARERRAIVHVMTRFMTYDGRGPLWVEVAATPALAGGREQFQVVCHDLSERLSVERALRESEERYRRLVESSPDAIYVQVNGVIVYANAAAANMLGVESSQALIGHHVLDHVHSEYRSIVADRIRRAMENNDIDPFVVERLRSYDGRDLYVHIRGGRVRYGQDEAIQVVLRDVSEQVRMAEDLRRTEQRLREVLDHSRDMSYRMDLHARQFDYVSPAAEYLSGLTPEEVQATDPQGILSSIHPDDRAGFVRAFDMLVSGAYRGDRAPAVEYRWLHPDGTYRWYSDNRSLVRGAGGEPVAVVGSVRDITEHREAAEALRESEARARALFENIGDAFLLFDDALRVVDCNERAEAMLGKPRETLLTQRAGDVGGRLAIAGDTLEAVLQEVLAGELPRHCAGVELWCDDAPEREPNASPATMTYVDLAAYSVRVDGRQRAALLCRDVTASRRLEAALRQSEQMEAVGRLAAGVAHDFGNLLGVVEGECELLETMLPADSPAAREVQAIQVVAESGVSVIRQLAAVGSDEGIEPEVLHLNLIIRRAEPVLCRLLRESVSLEFDLSAEPLFFWGDPGQVTRILANLVINAVDAIVEDAHRNGRAGRIRIATRPAHLQGRDARAIGLAPGRYAMLSVSDNGRGIAAEELPRLFQPHYTRHQAAGRHGLGLSVVYGIVAQNRGTVLVDSRPGAGTTFTIYVPALDPTTDAEASAPPSP